MNNQFQGQVVDLRSAFARVKYLTEVLLRDSTNPASMRFELAKLLVAVDTLLGLRCSTYHPEFLEDVPWIETIPLPQDVECDRIC